MGGALGASKKVLEVLENPNYSENSASSFVFLEFASVLAFHSHLPVRGAGPELRGEQQWYCRCGVGGVEMALWLVATDSPLGSPGYRLGCFELLTQKVSLLSKGLPLRGREWERSPGGRSGVSSGLSLSV